MSFLNWLGSNKDGIHTLVELVGLFALIGGAFKFLRQYARTRREEVMKRTLDMQREVFLELIGMMADTFTEVGRIAAPSHSYTPVTGLAGALLKVQILASEKTVEKVLKVSTLMNEGIVRILTLRGEAFKADAAVATAFQQVQVQYQQLVAAETIDRNGLVAMTNAATPASPVEHARMALQVAGQQHEQARSVGILAWTRFYDAMRDFLDGVADHSLAAIIAVRDELSVETDSTAFSAVVKTHRESARKVTLAIFDQIRRQHLALPAEFYAPQSAASQPSPMAGVQAPPTITPAPSLAPEAATSPAK